MKSKSNKIFKRIMLILLAIMLICFGSAALILKSSGFSPSLALKSGKANYTDFFFPWRWKNQMHDLDSDIKGLIDDNINNSGVLEDVSEFTEDKSCTLTDSISEINISTVSSELVIAPTNDNEIKANFSLKGVEGVATLNVEESDSKVNISVKYKNNLTFDMLRSSKLIIYIPTNFNKSMKISTVSGNGNVDLSALSLNDISINTTSGNFKINKLNSLTAQLTSVSGDMSINESFNGNELKMKSTSGSLDIKMPSGNTEMATVSGDINFSSYNNIKGSLNAKTTSGDIELSLENTPFKLEGSTTSGDFDIDEKYNANISKKNIAINNGNDYSIKINTVSGDLEIK